MWDPEDNRWRGLWDRVVDRLGRCLWDPMVDRLGGDVCCKKRRSGVPGARSGEREISQRETGLEAGTHRGWRRPLLVVSSRARATDWAASTGSAADGAKIAVEGAAVCYS